jgi:hypothetical protein
MTAKLKDLDSLKFPEVKDLLKRICKILGFRLNYSNLLFSPPPTWLLEVDDDTVVFLDGCNCYEFQTAKELLRGILNSRTFNLRRIGSFEEQTIQNPLYSLDLSTLQIKLDLLSSK